MTSPDTTRICPVTPLSLREGEPPRPAVHLDPHLPSFCADVHEIYDELVEEHPVVWSTTNGGFWMLTGYRPVYEATRDDALFTCSSGVGLPRDGEESALPPGTGPIPIETDPPYTQQYRKAALGPLSPRSVAALEPAIRAMADEFVDAFIETGEGDLVQQLATPLPARVTLRLLGMDESRWAEWVQWIHAIIHGTADEGREAQGAVFAHVTAEIQARTADPRGPDDLLTSIIGCQVDGEPIGFSEQVRYVFLILLGGMDTTSGLTGNALVHLGRDDELRRTLVERRDLLRTATEEFLRIGTPTQGQVRTLSRDVEFHGQQMRSGERALVLWAAANRDPAEFPDPQVVDLERWPNRHMAFGVGTHRCLGSNLARTMFQVMVDVVLDRLPDFRITVDQVPRFADACNVYAPTSLPVTFRPGARRPG
ncbi:cytochrome P450 [Blastococcus sp. URHD0036]|uniref:cytochrome P450 n=1 Tax=Blastococcus sp. URHD0036 TaxID=1380356 RepID=UPI00068D7458|nr:cytochrome P450 [Blastococcus sp. URHD0036]